MTLGKTYEITREGRTTTVHKHMFTFLRCKFDMDLPGPDDLEATGNLMDMEYEFVREDGGSTATVSKRWFAFADTYGVEIADGIDPVQILASAVVIDPCCHGDRRVLIDKPGRLIVACVQLWRLALRDPARAERCSRGHLSR